MILSVSMHKLQRWQRVSQIHTPPFRVIPRRIVPVTVGMDRERHLCLYWAGDYIPRPFWARGLPQARKQKNTLTNNTDIVHGLTDNPEHARLGYRCIKHSHLRSLHKLRAPNRFLPSMHVQQLKLHWGSPRPGPQAMVPGPAWASVAAEPIRPELSQEHRPGLGLNFTSSTHLPTHPHPVLAP